MKCQGYGCHALAVRIWRRPDLGRTTRLCTDCAARIRALNTRHGRSADADLYPLPQVSERNNHK